MIWSRPDIGRLDSVVLVSVVLVRSCDKPFLQAARIPRLCFQEPSMGLCTTPSSGCCWSGIANESAACCFCQEMRRCLEFVPLLDTPARVRRCGGVAGKIPKKKVQHRPASQKRAAGVDLRTSGPVCANFSSGPCPSIMQVTQLPWLPGHGWWGLRCSCDRRRRQRPGGAQGGTQK